MSGARRVDIWAGDRYDSPVGTEISKAYVWLPTYWRSIGKMGATPFASMICFDTDEDPIRQGSSYFLTVFWRVGPS